MLEATTASFVGVSVETALMEQDDVAAAPVNSSREHNLTITGTPREGVAQKLLFGKIREILVERSPMSVIIMMWYLDFSSRLQQSFRKFINRAWGNESPLEER